MPLDEIREVLAIDDPAERQRRLDRPPGPGRGPDAPPSARPPPRHPHRRREDPSCHRPARRPRSSTTATRRAPRRRAVQLHVDAPREPRPDAGPERRDDPRRPRLALPLGRGRRGGQPGPRRVAGARGCTRSLGRGEPALCHARRCVEINEANGRPRGLGAGRGRLRGDGPGDRRRRRPRRSRRVEVAGASRSWRRSPTPRTARSVEQDLATLPADRHHSAGRQPPGGGPTGP